MVDTPRNPTEARKWLRRAARQLREYEKGTAGELTPFIEHCLASYLRRAILMTLRGQDIEKSFGLAQPRSGAPGKRNQTKDPDAFSKQQDLIFKARILRRQGFAWKQIPEKIGYNGSGKALEKMCREQADLVEQTTRGLAERRASRIRQ
jgi:hypothetical protein